ncbi:phosphate:Na+ symporter [Alkalibacillus flavidus]|uniref:Phosphate:Na+ symporter n=1 Tax=Alkalibacillus flavidus TaxID=546021 RepID=A0ABV2KTL1_9BACI
MYSLLLLIFVLIGLLIFGLTLMKIGFRTMTERQLSILKEKLSKRNGLIFGFLMTILLQSSSVSIAMLMTFIRRGDRAVPFILCYLIGANIGTTLTTQLFVWNNTFLMISCLILGTTLILLPFKHYGCFSIGTIMLGLGTIFAALYGFENLTHTLTLSKVDHWLSSPQTSNVELLLTGFATTAVLQSSTTFTALLIGLSQDGAFVINHIFYLIVGANLGTCITVIILSIGQSRLAKMTAYSHVMINMLGMIIALIPQFKTSIIYIVTWAIDSVNQQIVALAFMYNVALGLIILIGLKPFSRVMTFIYERKV